MEKEIRWAGSAYHDLRAFPVEARRQDKRIAEVRYRAIVNTRKGKP